MTPGPLSPGELPLITRARLHGQRTAVEAPEGSLTYAELLARSEVVATRLLGLASGEDGGQRDLREARIAFLVPPGIEYPTIQWGVWRAGGIAVPLALSHPSPELAYVLDDAAPSVVVAEPELEDRIRPLAEERDIPVLRTDELIRRDTNEFIRSAEGSSQVTPALPAVATGRRAMMLYTSGTTGRPKGVVTTHANLAAQITSLVEAWGWQADDRILHILPLHHLHGILNLLLSPLWVGARCHFLEKFQPEETWRAISTGAFTLFMGVPTIYTKLLAVWDQAGEAERETFAAACGRMRLMVSGSAALPVRVLERWEEITGHRLLERYGMTEIGMGLSNPLHGVRRPGHVGTPLPGVQIRLVADGSGEPPPGPAGEAPPSGIAAEEPPPGVAGEIQVKGANVFLEYWRRPRETDDAFRDGWFLTGDVAVMEDGSFRILGRRSVDIIKTGGYKVSALEVEEVLREHPSVQDCAVVGVADLEWGERVAAAVVLGESASGASSDELRSWMNERVAPYKSPTLFRRLDDLPRNAMGKVVKPEVRKLFEESEEDVGEAGPEEASP